MPLTDLLKRPRMVPSSDAVDPETSLPGTSNQHHLVCVIAANTDHRLNQSDWADFCLDVHAVCHRLGAIFFAGSPPSSSDMQSYAIVFHLPSRVDLEDLHYSLQHFVDRYKHELTLFVSSSVKTLAPGLTH